MIVTIIALDAAPKPVNLTEGTGSDTHLIITLKIIPLHTQLAKYHHLVDGSGLLLP